MSRFTSSKARCAPNPRPPRPGAGALLVFDGIVRHMEDGRELAALDYEVYEPMATQQLIPSPATSSASTT